MWVAHPVISVIVPFLLAQLMADRIKACWRCKSKSSMNASLRLLSASTTCFASHPLANRTIHQVCLFPASTSEGKADTWILQCDLSQAPTLYFSASLLKRGGRCYPRAATKSVIQHLGAGWISRFSPKTRLLGEGELGQLYKAAAAQESWRQREMRQEQCQESLSGDMDGSCRGLAR